MTVAEGMSIANVALADDALQWGRNLTVAEGSSHSDVWTGAPGFNGAAT